MRRISSSDGFFVGVPGQVKHYLPYVEGVGSLRRVGKTPFRPQTDEIVRVRQTLEGGRETGRLRDIGEGTGSELRGSATGHRRRPLIGHGDAYKAEAPVVARHGSCRLGSLGADIPAGSRP